jgi:DNA (cytosine-5)-methyltransferase 1
MFTDYYNEIDPAAAAWLAELVEQGDLPFGPVDCRDIKTVVPGDLAYYDQCHFFAGIGGWALACKLAGWSGPLWTASLPCQPFSQAGAQRGVEDPRHLWPVFHTLVAQCLPPVLVGEQVASKAGRDWLAAVRADLEALGYAVGAADLCAAGVGAPHIRQRLYWAAVRVDNSEGNRPEVRGQLHGELSGQGFGQGCDVGGVAHNGGPGLEVLGEQPARGQREAAERGCPDHWSGILYVPCADGKCRPLPGATEPGAEPLVDGLSPLVVRGCGEGVPLDEVDPDLTTEARAMRLRGYGNAIVPELAAVFLRSLRDALEPPGPA